jgi:hypothetical protein
LRSGESRPARILKFGESLKVCLPDRAYAPKLSSAHGQQEAKQMGATLRASIGHSPLSNSGKISSCKFWIVPALLRGLSGSTRIRNRHAIADLRHGVDEDNRLAGCHQPFDGQMEEIFKASDAFGQLQMLAIRSKNVGRRLVSRFALNTAFWPLLASEFLRTPHPPHLPCLRRYK